MRPRACCKARQPWRPKPVAAPVAVVAKPAVAAAPAAPKKLSFKINELIVYPAHGVGKVVQIEEQEIAGSSSNSTSSISSRRSCASRCRPAAPSRRACASSPTSRLIEQAMKVLKGRARIKRTMWSRRAQEYEAKINSGDLIAVAEVVRDLYRSERQPEQSYSERQLFEQALERMAREIAAVRKIDDDMAMKEISNSSPRTPSAPRPPAKRPKKKPPPKKPHKNFPRPQGTRPGSKIRAFSFGGVTNYKGVARSRSSVG